jgi:hypothetical protein
MLTVMRIILLRESGEFAHGLDDGPEQVLVIPPKVLTHKRREFHFESGYRLLENVISKETIQYLRRVTDEMVAQTRALRGEESCSGWHCSSCCVRCYALS